MRASTTVLRTGLGSCDSEDDTIEAPRAEVEDEKVDAYDANVFDDGMPCADVEVDVADTSESNIVDGTETAVLNAAVAEVTTALASLSGAEPELKPPIEA